MKISIFSEILYFGINYEKGRVYTNYWKPWYKKKLSVQIIIWKELWCRMKEINTTDDDIVVFEKLCATCIKRKFIQYNIFVDLHDSVVLCLKSNAQRTLSESECCVINFIGELLVDIEKSIHNKNGKNEAYRLLRTLHNLPRTLILKKDLLNEEHINISCEDAIEYAFNNMSDEMKKKYNKYLRLK